MRTEMSAYDGEGRRKYLSREEGKRFMSQAALMPLHKALFCLTIYYTGCRISEAVNLTKMDLEKDQKLIRIHTLKKRTKQEIRRLPIPEFLIDGLVKLASESASERIWDFHRTTGWRTVKAVMAAAEISGIQATTKGLRHGFGVRGALESIPVSVIRDWMGHADSETTAIYLDVKDDEERELMGRMWK
jgi:integrase